jgi:hypothetical protein
MAELVSQVHLVVVWYWYNSLMAGILINPLMLGEKLYGGACRMKEFNVLMVITQAKATESEKQAKSALYRPYINIFGLRSYSSIPPIGRLGTP